MGFFELFFSFHCFPALFLGSSLVILSSVLLLSLFNYFKFGLNTFLVIMTILRKGKKKKKWAPIVGDDHVYSTPPFSKS